MQTDHTPLVSLWTKFIVCNSPLHQRLLLLRLSQYDVNIEYLKGKDNVIADALSRVSSQPTTKEEGDEEDFIPVHVLTGGNPRGFCKNQRFQKRKCRRHYFRLTDAGGSKRMA